MKQNGSGSCIDFIFRTPKKLEFAPLYRYYFDFILRLLYRVIVFDNVPDTVSETFLKMVLFTQGKACFLRGDLIGEGEELLALNCTRADTPDVYYIPRKILVTNPRLKKSYNLTPGVDCEILYLSEPDKYALGEFGGGLYELIKRTATMLADNDISINIAQKNTRLVNLISGDTQNTVDSIRAVIASMYNGDPSIVVKSSLIDKLQGIPLLQSQSNHNLVELIEVTQYIISHFYEQIGICTHDQMKRERLITAEVNDNLDLAFLNIDDIIVTLQEGLYRINKRFDTNIIARINEIIKRQRERAFTSAEELTEEEPAAEQEAAPEIEPEAQSEEEAPEEEAEPEPEEEPEPVEEAQSDEEPQEAATEEEAEQEPEEEPKPEEEPQEVSQDITLEVTGDNNTIIIAGGDSVDDPTEDDPEDVDLDNDDGALGD